MAMCKGAIDIEIETSADFQGKGLGTTVGAKLVLYCLENNIEPKWLAANPGSEKFALKIGYTKIGTYDIFGIKY
jgi:RimJ/RimL family protein N-acetyltransferase